MALGESNDRQLPTIAFLCGPSAAPIVSQADRVREWRCCDCATLNHILSPSQRRFVSHLARSLPAASLANSPAYRPVKSGRNFTTEKTREGEKEEGGDGGTKMELRELEQAMKMWDVGLGDGAEGKENGGQGGKGQWDDGGKWRGDERGKWEDEKGGGGKVAGMGMEEEQAGSEAEVLVCGAEKCEHVRCGDCFDVDKTGRMIARCGGRKVDEGEYLSWCYLMGK